MFFLRKLRSFNVHKDILHNFFQSIVHSVLTFGSLCWGGNVTAGDIHRIDRVIRKAEKLMGREECYFSSFLEDRDRAKLARIRTDETYPLRQEFISRELPSGRYRVPALRTERYRGTFVPRSILAFNGTFRRGAPIV